MHTAWVRPHLWPTMLLSGWPAHQRAALHRAAERYIRAITDE